MAPHTKRSTPSQSPIAPMRSSAIGIGPALSATHGRC